MGVSSKGVYILSLLKQSVQSLGFTTSDRYDIRAVQCHVRVSTSDHGECDSRVSPGLCGVSTGGHNTPINFMGLVNNWERGAQVIRQNFSKIRICVFELWSKITLIANVHLWCRG